jgi:hypothetical protein
MKAAGFKRSEFRVRTEIRRFTYRGRRCREYGDAYIYTHGSKVLPKNELIEMIPYILSAGLDVRVYILKTGEISTPMIIDNHRVCGHLILRDFRKDG